MEKKNETFNIDVMHILFTLLKRWWLIALATLIGAVTAYGYTRYRVTPVYEADAYMFVNNTSISIGSAKISVSDLSTAESLVDTYSVILQRRLTLEKVIEEANLNCSYEALRSKVSASSVNGTEIFVIKVYDSDPNQACLIANTIIEVLPERISAIISGASAAVVDVAVVPTTPISPSYSSNLVKGMAIGFVLCAALIAVFDIFNDTIDSEDWITSTYGDELPLLAICPDADHNGSHRYGKYGYKNYSKYGYKYGYYYGSRSNHGSGKENNGSTNGGSSTASSSTAGTHQN